MDWKSPMTIAKNIPSLLNKNPAPIHTTKGGDRPKYIICVNSISSANASHVRPHTRNKCGFNLYYPRNKGGYSISNLHIDTSQAITALPTAHGPFPYTSPRNNNNQQ